MVTDLALKSFLEYLLPLYNSLGIIQTAHYVPELDFRRAALDKMNIFSDVVNNKIVPIFNEISEESDDRRRGTWGVACWSRQSLVNNDKYVYQDYLVNLVTDEETHEGLIAHMKLVDLQVNVVIFCNSPYLAETVEEYTHMLFHNQQSTTFTYPLAEEEFPLYINRTDEIMFDKLPHIEMGALSSVSFGFTLTYPIFRDIGAYPLIYQIIQKNYVGTEDHPELSYIYSTYTIGTLPPEPEPDPEEPTP